jgi:cyclase
VDREGTGAGFDVQLTAAVATTVDVPVIASGGAGRVDHIRRVLLEGSADAVAIASMLHYRGVQVLPLASEASEGNLEFLRSGRPPSKAIEPCTIGELAAALSRDGFSTRLVGPTERVS